jgi:hypothetical protein
MLAPAIGMRVLCAYFLGQIDMIGQLQIGVGLDRTADALRKLLEDDEIDVFALRKAIAALQDKLAGCIGPRVTFVHHMIGLIEDMLGLQMSTPSRSAHDEHARNMAEHEQRQKTAQAR